MRNFFALSGLLAMAALLPSPAFAQDQEEEENRDIRVRVGLGAQYQPEWLGDDDHKLGPLFDLSIAKGDKPFKFGTPGDSFGIGLVSFGPVTVGPAAKLQGSRKESDVGAPVGKVKATIEAGAFAQAMILDQVRIRGELRKGIGGHEGIVGSLGVDQVWRDGDRYLFSVGPRVNFSNARYQRAYFGVTPAVALATGLPVHRPGAGLHSLGAVATMHHQIGGAFGMFGYGRYERLVGDAAKSPIIREFGSKNQFAAGVGLSYTFVVKR